MTNATAGDTSARGLAGDTALLFLARTGAMGLLFAAGVLTARLLDPAARGEYGLLTSTVATLAVVANLGFPESLIYFYNRGEADERRVATSVLGFSGLVALLCGAIGLIAVPWLATHYFPSGGTSLAWLAIASGAVAVLHRNGLAALFARHRFAQASAAILAQPLLFAAALIAFFFVGTDLRAVALGFALTWLAAAAWVALPLVPKLQPGSLSSGYVRRVASFSGRSYGNAVATQLNYRLDIFLVGYLVADLEIVAFYHIATTLSALLWLFPDAIAQALYPRLAALEDERERSRQTIQSLRHALLTSGLAAGGLALVAPVVVPALFGATYQPAVRALHLLLPGVVAMCVAKVLVRFLFSRNAHGSAAVASALGAVSNVVLNLVLVPRYGLDGAALAATGSYLFTAALFAGLYARLADGPGDAWSGFPLQELRQYARTASQAFTARSSNRE